MATEIQLTDISKNTNSNENSNSHNKSQKRKSKLQENENISDLMDIQNDQDFKEKMKEMNIKKQEDNKFKINLSKWIIPPILIGVIWTSLFNTIIIQVFNKDTCNKFIDEVYILDGVSEFSSSQNTNNNDQLQRRNLKNIQQNFNDNTNLRKYNIENYLEQRLEILTNLEDKSDFVNQLIEFYFNFKDSFGVLYYRIDDIEGFFPEIQKYQNELISQNNYDKCFLNRKGKIYIKLCFLHKNQLQKIQKQNLKNSKRNLVTETESQNLKTEFYDLVYAQAESNLITNYILSIVVIILSFFASGFLIHKVGNYILTPLYDLNSMVQSIQQESVETDLMKGYTPVYKEVDQLTQSLQQLNIYLIYSSDDFFKGNDSDSLIKYANALELYQKTNSIKGQGIALNNMANLHLKNGRTLEAIENYKQALNLVTIEFLNFVKHSHLHVFYKVRPVNGWDSLNKNNDKLNIDIQKNQMIQQTKDKILFVVNYKKKQKLESIISNRLYNLCIAYITFASQNQMTYQKNFELIDMIIDNLSLVTKIDRNLKRKNSKQIKAFIYLSEALAIKADLQWKIKEEKTNQLIQRKKERDITIQEEQKLQQEINDIDQQAQDNVHDSLYKMTAAENLLQEYEQVYKLFVEDENRDDPPSIIQQKILFQKGLIHKIKNSSVMASQYFSSCIQFGEYYALDIRKRSLENLSEIFLQNKLYDESQNILKLLKSLERKKNKDIIFLLDYSESMKYGNRQKNSVLTLLKIFDNYVSNQDRLAYVRFNHQVKVLFELQDMNMNQNFTRNTIFNTLNEEPTGQTAFFYALNESMNIFKKSQNKKNNKWIVCLTDGDDSCSQISQKQIQKRLKLEKIGLIVIGIGLNEAYSQDLNKLCTKTGGFFIESLDSKDIDIAMQSISNLNYSKNEVSDGLIVEQFR